MACPPTQAVATTAEDIWTIRHSTLFGRLRDDSFDSVFAGQKVHVAPKSALLFQWGTEATTCFILLKGLVKLFRTAESGETAVLAIHGPGRPLMLAEGLTGKPCSASAETVSPVRLMCLDVATLRTRMQADSAMSMTLLAAAASDLRILVSQVEELKGMTGPARVAAMILTLLETRVGATRVTLPYEKKLIAGRLGMTPESFSRSIRELRTHGVSVSREKLEITDLARLKAYVHMAA